MSKRSSNLRVSNECNLPCQARRNKKRISRKHNAIDESWCNNEESQEPSEDEVPGMEYTSMFWRHPRIPHTQPHMSHDGQRLFTAMSDPSVCGYSAVPVTYAMEPVSVPPMYRLYQPVIRPNYRPYRGRTRPSMTRMQSEVPCNSDALGNGYSSLQENGWSPTTQVAYQNGDYASLPPTANLENKTCRDALNSEHRRYSDPGLGPAGSPENLKSPDSDCSDSGSSITTVGRNNKLFLSLVEQMTKMKETSSQLFKELHQAKSELENVKTELSQLKQNVPVEYQPGMLTDVIKEIRDASRIKEDVMFSNVKRMIESQQSESSTELEQLKEQLETLRSEKQGSDQRLEKLERDLEALRVGIDNKNREIAAFEEENLSLRRELQEARATTKKAVSVNHQQQQQQSGNQQPSSGKPEGKSKLEGLMKMLRGKAQTPAASAGADGSKKPTSSKYKSSGIAAVAATTTELDDSTEESDNDSSSEETENDRRLSTSEESSRNNSCNNGSDNSLASGPVTDL